MERFNRGTLLFVLNLDGTDAPEAVLGEDVDGNDNVGLVCEVLGVIDVEQRQIQEDEDAGEVKSSDDAGLFLKGHGYRIKAKADGLAGGEEATKDALSCQRD